MSSISIDGAVLIRSGAIVSCLIGGEAVARVNVSEASEDEPLTLWMGDRRFSLTLEQTKEFLAGMPRPAPVIAAEEASAAEEAPVVEEAPAADEAPAPAKRRRR